MAQVSRAQDAIVKPRRTHGWIPYYRAPVDPSQPFHVNANTIDSSGVSLLAEHGMRMGDTTCGLPEKRLWC